MKLANGEAESVSGASATLSAPVPSGEQRQVTVLFADLAGFTQLSGELGAEATHALLNRYFETVDAVVEGYGGTIDKHMGDNVMAVFGAPVAHSDDPERALRAALDIHHTMTELTEEFGRPLQAHIGIASGHCRVLTREAFPVELWSAQRRPTSIRPPEAIRCSRPMVADKCATLARLMAHHDISTEPQSLEATGVRPSQRETALWAK